jgi:hypothetical protein
VAPAGKQREEARRLGGVGRLAEQAAAEGDDGVGGEHGRFVAGRDRLGLADGEAQRTGARALAPGGALVDLGGEDGVGDDTDLGEQVAAARAGGAEDQPRAQALT